MELEELKLFLKVDDDSLDAVLSGYQRASEKYLENAGVTKDYDNPLYKVCVSVIAGTFLENPVLMGSGAVGEIKNMSLNGLIAQLRWSQEGD